MSEAMQKLADDPSTSLYRKLAEVTTAIGRVPKSGYNSFHKYHYVMEADLVDAVRNELAKRNIVLIPSVTSITERQTQGGKPSTVTTVHVAFTFVDGDTGRMHKAEWAGSGDDPADKGLYKAYTGAVKYFLMKCFLIPTGDDPEADGSTDERASAPAPKVQTINEADATRLYGEAKAAGIANDRLMQAIAHISGTQASSLDALTGPQALKLGAWIEKKRNERDASPEGTLPV